LELLFTSIDYKDPIWIATAFAFGALVRGFGLPPLVGFLIAGFALNYAGIEGGEFLHEMADIGITLLLFTIGLKIKINDLLQREVWAGSLIHMLIFSSLSIAFLLLLKAIDIPVFNDLSLVNTLIVSFALSFSSTVLVVKSLEVSGNFGARYGQVAVGILIIQDLIAVIFLGFSEAKIPSLWAFLLLTILFFGRRFLGKILSYIGHGELQILFGLSLALGGAALFELVDMKADLGALVFGVLLASHKNSGELARALFSLKELFLVGFFLSIGLTGLPDLSTLMIVALLSPLLLLKSSLFFLILTRLGVRAYTASNTSLVLGNYSEFGLIVTNVAVIQGWLPVEWLAAVAVLVAVSFTLSSAVNKRSEYLYDRFASFLSTFQAPSSSQADIDIDLKGVNILVCGMGRVGCGAYEFLENENNILALDFDNELIAIKQAQGYQTAFADISSTDFWSQLDIRSSQIEWLILTAPNVHTNIAAAKLARRWGYDGFISASAKYRDDEPKLTESGINAVFNIYEEAGAGLALHGKKWMSAQLDVLG
jgi:glutathione-regulated potassium-efflux system ancillary protein KefC